MTNCPNCGSQPTDESIVYSRLSDVGYLHTDTKFECSECTNTWIIGEPEGETESDAWVCESCGGDYMPHFLFVNTGENTFRVRPKCQDCFHVPDEQIDITSRFNGENIRGFIGHHTTTGDRDTEEPPI